MGLAGRFGFWYLASPPGLVDITLLQNLSKALVTLGLLLGLPGRPALAQRPPPSAATGFISGRVVDDSSHALVGAEVVLLELRLRALTGPDGQFRLERVPLGTWSILVRAIGFLPHTRSVQLTGDAFPIGVLTLHQAAVLLPEIKVEAKIPAPAFALGFRTALDGAESCSVCGGLYSAAGASMSDDGLYLVTNQRFGPKNPPVIDVRSRWIGLGDFGGGGPKRQYLTCETRSRPLASRVDAGIARALYADGTVWLQQVRPGSWECLRSVLLFVGGRPLGAAGLGQGWVIAMEDHVGSASLIAVSDFGQPLWTVPLALALAVDSVSLDLILAPARGGVTVALTDAPFTWALVDSTGTITLRSSPLMGLVADSLLQRATRDRWKSYAVLPVRNGFVQTLESPRVGEGLFVLYDILGRPVKVMRRAGASVLLASVPEMRMLFGYQYNSPWGGRSRLFMYRY